MRRLTGIVSGLLACVLLTGFSLDNPQVPVQEIRPGGPSPDSIPAIVAPEMIAPDEAGYLADEDQVVGLRIGQDARAYPLKILNYHQVINDRVGDVPLAVTYCPLSGAVLIFYRLVAGQEVTFGVSGLLYRSNVLLYDHETRSLWSQMLRKAVTGPLAGRRLDTQSVPLALSWSEWKKRFPAAGVLSNQTGFDRDYHIDPYGNYATSAKLWHPVGRVRRDLPPKTRVLGVASGSHAKAYPLDRLAAEGMKLHDVLGGQAIDIAFRVEGNVTAAAVGDDTPLEVVGVYWFAWQAFYPHTLVAH